MSNNIKSADLHKIWSAPDNSRLIPKQISIRLPVHVAAKIYALEEIYSTKSRTQIINDLLSTALEDLESSLPSVKGEEFDTQFDDRKQPPREISFYYDEGIRGTYYKAYTRNLTALEKQLGNDDYNTEFEAIYIDDEPSLMTTQTHGKKQ